MPCYLQPKRWTHVQRRTVAALSMLCASELSQDGEYACATRVMQAMEKNAFVSVYVCLISSLKGSTHNIYIAIAVLCIINETNLLHLMWVMCVFEAINPCLDGNNGRCHADGDCIHTGPNKVGGKYKQTIQIASKENIICFILSYNSKTRLIQLYKYIFPLKTFFLPIITHFSFYFLFHSMIIKR